MSRLARSLRRLRRSTRGAAAVEFAIVSGVLIALLIGIIDLGRALYTQNHISFLADRAARRVLINPEVTDADLEAELRAQFSAGDPESLTIEIATRTTGGADYRVVTVAFPLTLFIPKNSGVVTLSVTRMVPAG